MKLEDIYKRVVSELTQEGVRFAICGGVAAMLYRAEIRYTGDIDFLLDSGPRSIELANRLISEIGLKPHPLRSAELSMAPRANKRTSPIEVIVGRHETNERAFGLDFLFPIQAWTGDALQRAQSNRLSLHGTEAPFLTSEDVILAKLTAINQSGGRREKDWSDVQSILESGRYLDLAFIAARISELKIVIPIHLEKQLTGELRLALKHARNS